MPNKDLFFMVMEADGDEMGMDAFDENAATDAGTSEDIAPPATEENGGGENVDDAPPDMDSDFGDMGGLNDVAGDDQTGGDEMSDENGEGNEEEEADQKDGKLSEKANNILNQQLYNKFVARNKDVEGILTSIKDLVPLLPYDVIKSNDKSVNQLKSALQKGQEYVINDFVDSGYGENLLFYQKLDSLYVLLLNRIDSNLKKIKNNQS
jgi:hypothetical protein